ncbi:hypothetical protein [Lacticaseibacillus pantheris]
MVDGVMGVRLFGMRHLIREATRSNGGNGSGAVSAIILIAVVFALWYLVVPRLRARRRAQQQQDRVAAFAETVEQPQRPTKVATVPLGVANRDEFIALARHVQAAVDQRDRSELTRYTTKHAWTQMTRDWPVSATPVGYTELTFDNLARLATDKDELLIRATITSTTMPVGTDAEPEAPTTTTSLWELQRSEHGWVVNKINEDES